FHVTGVQTCALPILRHNFGMEQDKKARRSYLGTVLGCYCPRCREGKLFEKPLSFKLSRLMKMNKNCPVCGQPTELEVGFFYGTKIGRASCRERGEVR